MEPVLSTTTRRRGHQHHPRHSTRRRLDQNLQSNDSSNVFSGSDSGPAQCGPAGVDANCAITKEPDKVTLGSSPKRTLGRKEPKLACDKKLDVKNDELGASKKQTNSSSEEDDSVKSAPVLKHADARARGDGNSDEETASVEEDPELAELAKLRCSSKCTEVLAAREARRRNRCADYPGLAFGCSIFSSDTMMKFSLIKNELQNIMGNQLKRVSILGYISTTKYELHI